jgi:CBS domain containing-hemolysin-like protein
MASPLIGLVGLVVVVILVALNGFFVAAEYSLVTVRWTRVEELVAQGKFGAVAVRDAKEKIDEAIAASQLGVTIASLGLGWIGEPAVARLFEPMFRGLPPVLGATVIHGIAIGIAFLAIVYLHVVLGELAPKALALQRAEDVALIVAGPLLAFGRVFRLLTMAMKTSGTWVVKLLRLPPIKPEADVHSVSELEMLVAETEEAGVIPADQASYARNVFRLSDRRVRDIMVPRDQVVTLSLGSSEEEILETCREHAHTRMPVWDGHPDNIVGIVNTKNLFHIFSLRGLVLLMDAMYPAIFVDPDQPVSRLLRRFKRDRRPMAVVRDGAGKFLGVVTIEDILEEIVGEIEDEHDD